MRRSAENHYSWSVAVDHGALAVEINDQDGKSIAVDAAPNYVLADIARVMASGSFERIRAQKRGRAKQAAVARNKEQDVPGGDAGHPEMSHIDSGACDHIQTEASGISPTGRKCGKCGAPTPNDS